MADFFADFTAECGCKGKLRKLDIHGDVELEVTIIEHCKDHQSSD
jgi:hypothetical protein